LLSALAMSSGPFDKDKLLVYAFLAAVFNMTNFWCWKRVCAWAELYWPA
jgi:hypothetical protein